MAVTERLAASIAHEINNPLEAVTNLLFLLRQCEDAEKSRHCLASADHELARVAEITRHTLRFCREPSHPVDTQVEGVLRPVLVLYHSRLAAANVEASLEVLPPRLLCFRVQASCAR
jgi:C4-dicarboxylate-specific signal transduction histidine kinase